MRAIVFDQPGDESVMRVGEAPAPELGPGDLRIRVAAAGVNRADLLQRAGLYPPPPGASPLLGLECAGEVAEVGSDVTGWSVGERAMALLAGGGYAEEGEADVSSLFIAESRVDEGPTMKRFQPKDRGRAHPIMKRSSHLHLVLDERN